MSSDELTALQQDIREIKTAIIGNESMGQDGLVNKVKSHESRLSHIETYILMGVGGFTFLSLLYAIARDVFLHHG